MENNRCPLEFRLIGLSLRHIVSFNYLFNRWAPCEIQFQVRSLTKTE